MFTASLNCGACGFHTPTFILGYIPSLGTIDLVFQVHKSNAFRIVRCPFEIDHSSDIGDELADQLFRANLESLIAVHKQSDESLILQLDALDREKQFVCPACGSKSVVVKLLSIV